MTMNMKNDHLKKVDTKDKRWSYIETSSGSGSLTGSRYLSTISGHAHSLWSTKAFHLQAVFKSAPAFTSH